MTITAYPNGVSSFGVPVLPFNIPPGGNIFFLDPGNSAPVQDGKTPETAFSSFTTAYAALTANQNDVLFYIGGSSGLTLSAAATWAKNYTHFIGLCAPTHAAQRCRIFQLSTLTGASPLLTISATGCIFANFYIFQGVDDATSLINVSVTGGRNYFYNVHFAGGGHASNAIDGCASLHLNGAEENLFERCTIGVDTISAATGVAGLVFAATGGADRNKFVDCVFRLYAGNAGAIFIELLGNSGLDRDQLFKDCEFINLSATSLTEAIHVAAGFDANNKRLLLKNCEMIGAGEWDNGDSGLVYLSNGAITAGGNSGIWQATNTT